MSITRSDLGDPIAIGRSAELFVWPNALDQVVKLFPSGTERTQLDNEVTASQEATTLGLTSLVCHGVVEVEDRLGIVFDRVHGESLTRQAEKNPLKLKACARTLARCHADMHTRSTTEFVEVRAGAIAALDTEPLSFLTDSQHRAAVERIESLPSGTSVLHFDFHSENVFSHHDDHVVIDWPTAMRGNPAADVAATVLMFEDAELWPGTPRWKLVVLQAVRRIVLRTYLAEYQRITNMTGQEIAAWKVPALVMRMSTLDVVSERDNLRSQLLNLLGTPT